MAEEATPADTEKCQKVHFLEEGDEVMILVGGQPVSTYIDEHGTQRFMTNGVMDWLWRSGSMSLDRLWKDFWDGQFDRDGFIEVYMGLGYSVGAFAEVWGVSSTYHDRTGEFVEVVNPVWLDAKEMQET